MPTIFISYSQKDAKDVDRLEKLLKEASYEVLKDESGIVNGEEIADTILNMLKASQFFLLCYSKHSQKAAWVNWECGIATERTRAGKMKMKILRLDDSLPMAFLALKRYDDFDTLFSHDTLDEKKAALNSILSTRRRRILVFRGLRITVVWVSVGLLLVAGAYLQERSHYKPAQMAIHQVSRKGDHIGNGANGSVELLATKWEQAADSTTWLTVRCKQRSNANKFFLSSATHLTIRDHHFPLQAVIADGQVVHFGQMKSLLLAVDLQDGDALEMQLVFATDSPLSKKQKAELSFHFRHSTYGLGQIVNLEFQP